MNLITTAAGPSSTQSICFEYLFGDLQMQQFMPPSECEWRDYCQEVASMPEMPFTQCPCPPRSLPWQNPSMENGTRQ